MTAQNRLSKEKSPYLLQHQHNPVWWYPWGKEAFEAARAADKPIFLSIGYATCHWCHVMERESFEDRAVAALLNRAFICIKVDREELPDVDQIYMNALHAMGNRGGWPLTIVMTPALRPFFGGTYFPKPRLMYILERILYTWNEERDRVETLAHELYQHLATPTTRAGGVLLQETLLEQAFQHELQAFDPEYGGFGSAPKFPPSQQLRVLLRIWRRTGDPRALVMVERTLEGMAFGGMYDHVGGGFARYSTDERWLVPHFEKMLYDNALLSISYLEAFQATQKAWYADVARETLDYILRRMTAPEGGFYSAEDADSEGEEGRFYVWSWQELQQILTGSSWTEFEKVFDVNPSGNFEHQTHVLSLRKGKTWPDRQVVVVREALQKLYLLREKRIPPLKDDKVLTSWNGLMIEALSRAAAVLREPRYLQAARKAADFIWTHLQENGVLFRRWRAGERRYEGTLEDYAWLIQGLISLYEVSHDEQYIHAARLLQHTQDEKFLAAEGGYYYSPSDATDLIIRTREFTDGATPNANGVSALNLLRLSMLFVEPALERRAVALMESAGKLFAQHPYAFSSLLLALDFYTDQTQELVTIIPSEPLKQAKESRALEDALATCFIPNRVLAWYSDTPSTLPLVGERKAIQGKVTYYVCERGTCQLPSTHLKDVLSKLERMRNWTLQSG
ncbi:MAG: thioredoxin domain-containing protein [Myxococcota bacterium]